ncbi:MAG: hypothetical protein AAGF01_11425 [Cyanobacteria bacterium P01_G01_bin.38]
MNETDMELQAIRQKLQSLKAEPIPEEALAIPWSQPRARLPDPGHPPLASGPDLAQVQVNAAIEALKQRSSQPYSGSSDSLGDGSPGGRHAAQRYGAFTGTALDPILQRFESQLQTVNRLAEQQESAILGLKQLADHITDIMHRQGIDDHPKLAAIAALFETYPSTVIPIFECDQAGNYGLEYRTVDFYQAEHDAQLTAQTLRSRGSEKPVGQTPGTDLPTYFNQPPNHEPPGHELTSKPTGFFEEGLLFLQSIWELTLSSFNPGARASRQRSRSRFTLLDAAIWFSGAAITRILLDVIFQIYPALWTPLVVTLIGVVAVTLYRTLLSNRPSLGFSYRILVALVGLFMGGQFL